MARPPALFPALDVAAVLLGGREVVCPPFHQVEGEQIGVNAAWRTRASARLPMPLMCRELPKKTGKRPLTSLGWFGYKTTQLVRSRSIYEIEL